MLRTPRKWSVLWAPEAQSESLRIWADAPDSHDSGSTVRWTREHIRLAVNSLETELTNGPYLLGQGEVGPDNIGLIWEGSLLGTFQAEPDNVRLTILDIRLRPPPEYFPSAPPQVVAGVRIVNVTPHNLWFEVDDEQVVPVPQTGILIGATVEREVVRNAKGVDFVRVRHRPTSEGSRQLDAVEREFPDAVVVGSMIAARAYPGRVVVPIPLPGYERVRMNEKRYRVDAFETLE